GYFVLPYTLGNYLGQQGLASAGKVTTADPAFDEAEKAVRDRVEKLLSIKGDESPRSFHQRLGKIMWDKCGMARKKADLEAAIKEIQALRKEFWTRVRVVGEGDGLNQELERAGRVADFLEFGELLCRDALMREESCGGHFRVEHQSMPDDPEVKSGLISEGEAKRDDDKFAFVGVWEYQGDDTEPKLHKESLTYEEVHMATRSYK
ncbi:MAG: fumarate reductase/succinate dehydrogenase flavoprotein subunit, partial [Puniceicoccales bacterium]